MQGIIKYWVYGGSLAGILILALSPVICFAWPLALTLVFLQLPIYMLHQFEEHNHDRFRTFFNDILGKGQPVLSEGAVCFINTVGVWGVNAVSISLAFFAGIGFGLIGIYLTLVNALIHIAQAVALRRYNPGLVTAIVFFLPLSILALWAMHLTGQAKPQLHALGLAAGIGIHLAIIAYVRVRLRTLSRPAS